MLEPIAWAALQEQLRVHAERTITSDHARLNLPAPESSPAGRLLSDLRDHGYAVVSVKGSTTYREALANRLELVHALFDDEDVIDKALVECPFDCVDELGVAVLEAKRFFAFRRVGSEHALRFPVCIAVRAPSTAGRGSVAIEQNFEVDVGGKNKGSCSDGNKVKGQYRDTAYFGPRLFELFDALDTLARDTLAAVAIGLGSDPDGLLQLCWDPKHIPPSGRDESMLHLFDYFGAADATGLGCIEHTDSGLVTVIPVLGSGRDGLECLDWRECTWSSFEPLDSSPNDLVVVLAGETLARLTCNYIQGTVHRVVCGTSRRLSTPFQLRAHPGAVLDSLSLASPLFQVPRSLQEPVTVEEFIS